MSGDQSEQIIKNWHRVATKRHKRAKREWRELMSDYDNMGYLARNIYRRADNQPTHVGKIRIDGKAYKLAAWIQTKDDGSRLFSLRVTRPDKAGGQGGGQRPSQGDLSSSQGYKSKAAKAQDDLMTPLGDPELDDEIGF